MEMLTKKNNLTSHVGKHIARWEIRNDSSVGLPYYHRIPTTIPGTWETLIGLSVGVEWGNRIQLLALIYAFHE